MGADRLPERMCSQSDIDAALVGGYTGPACRIPAEHGFDRHHRTDRPTETEAELSALVSGQSLVQAISVALTLDIPDRVAEGPKGVTELADPNFGLFEGLLEQELAERHPKRHKQWQDDPLSLTPPEGEPIGYARARILKTASKLVKKTRAREIAFVVHPVALGLLRCRLADLPSEDLWNMLENGSRVERFAFAIAWADRLLEPVGAAAVDASPAGASI